MLALEFGILDWIQENMRCAPLDAIMPYLTKLGDGGILWIILAVVLVCMKKYRRYGIMMGIALLSGLIIGNLGLKPLVARARPCWINGGVDLLIPSPKDYSFPSGHTLAAAEASTVAMYADKRIGIPAVIMAALLAFSRMYLYVHFPTDILAGALLGTGIGILTVYIYRRKTEVK